MTTRIIRTRLAACALGACAILVALFAVLRPDPPSARPLGKPHASSESSQSRESSASPLLVDFPNAPARADVEPVGTDQPDIKSVPFTAPERPREEVWQEKYLGKTGPELCEISAQLNLELDAQLRAAAAVLRAAGQYHKEFHLYSTELGGPSVEFPRALGPAPEGKGRVYPVTQIPHSGGMATVETAWVTEADNPEVFNLLDERKWVIRRASLLMREAEEKY